MRKEGAMAILTTIFTGLFAWAGLQITDNKTNLEREKTINEYQIEMLREMRSEQKEMRSDIKAILQRVK